MFGTPSIEYIVLWVSTILGTILGGVPPLYLGLCLVAVGREGLEGRGAEDSPKIAQIEAEDSPKGTKVVHIESKSTTDEEIPAAGETGKEPTEGP